MKKRIKVSLNTRIVVQKFNIGYLYKTFRYKKLVRLYSDTKGQKGLNIYVKRIHLVS